MYRYSLLTTSASTSPTNTAAMSVEEEKRSVVDEKGGKVAQVEDSIPPDVSVGPSAEERRLVRKLDVRIMPIACILYLFACE